MNHAIEVTNLEKCYGAHKVLKGLTFSVRQGEIFAPRGQRRWKDHNAGMSGRAAPL